jgi:transposase
LHKRKNWLFVGSEAAGESMAALLSLTQTCRAMGINPQTYLEDLFRHLQDSPAKDLAQWLPDAWQARQPATATVPDPIPVLPDDAPPSA